MGVKPLQQGIARQLLAACEDLVVNLGGVNIYLHVRESDQAARGLYEDAGYIQQSTDGLFATIFGDQGRRILMCKQLRTGSNAIL
ncbi:hypothetical protein CYMTET_34381 [Cymbomonas tetramitiformis]|uniref:N-acetyltransferase domain-containing protein n=1 Tax=Cymbomonas tetramitiformis TaxID=36881 RepID=A0AAE0FB85_9CHLO|nr:hypothetical protein CYMTET_34381 [Cymbomonas tetramitiformis]